MRLGIGSSASQMDRVNRFNDWMLYSAMNWIDAEMHVDRRTFVEALSSLLMAANAPLVGRAATFPIDGQDSDKRREREAQGPIPLPHSVSGVQRPVVDLGGEWRMTFDPPPEFWRADMDRSSWSKVAMPNEFAMLGFNPVPNTEYPCARKISVPADYTGHRIFIRFDGVYSYARVWVNGVFIREHFGGFTSWDCEITDHVTPGREATVVLGVTDRRDDISQASYYAKHSIAGILRDVRIFALPRVYLNRLSSSASLDAQYENGLIRLDAEISSQGDRTAQIVVALTDMSGASITPSPASIPASGDRAQFTNIMRVSRPKHWDAEHPNLYMLEVSVVVNGSTTQTVRRSIGFRSIQRVGNQLLVNGQPVKLRGVCRHSIHPTRGRAVPPEFDELDAELFRAANINFVRTSHYPPSEQFLDACDRHGIYVEEEAAVSWSAVDGGVSSDPQFRERFLMQFNDMIVRDRDRASVLFWSLGNESYWGSNFAAEHRLATEMDSSRPTIFSFPETLSMESGAPWKPVVTSTYEIFSRHYADVHSDLRSNAFPLLNDEFAHIACYNLDVLRRDPGIRNFWGESIRRFGDQFLKDDGCLGGAIWAGIDEIFLMEQGPVGYGPWGIVDGWRRPKPEYWLTKKAYSPIRIVDEPLVIPREGDALRVPVRNAFDHTNLKDVEIRWRVGADSGVIHADISPHRSGYLELPVRGWKAGDILQLEFVVRGIVIDEFDLSVDPPVPALRRPMPSAASLHRSADRLVISGTGFSVTVLQSTGLISEARFGDRVVVKGGPYLDYGAGPILGQWLLRSCEAVVDGGSVVIRTVGECKRGDGIDGIRVEFQITIDGDGLIATRYRVAGGFPANSPFGIAYLLTENVDRVKWHRQGLWSRYPVDHIGRPRGVALRKAAHPPAHYGVKPEWPWAEDQDDPFLWGKAHPAAPASNDFRALRENIWYFSCCFNESNIRVRAEADAAELSARSSVMADGVISLSLYSYWPYPDLSWGNYTGPGAAPALTHPEIKIRLTDLSEED